MNSAYDIFLLRSQCAEKSVTNFQNWTDYSSRHLFWNDLFTQFKWVNAHIHTHTYNDDIRHVRTSHSVCTLNVHANTFASILVNIKGFLDRLNCVYIHKELVPHVYTYELILKKMLPLSCYLLFVSHSAISWALNFAFVFVSVVNVCVCLCVCALICSFELIKSNENGWNFGGSMWWCLLVCALLRTVIIGNVKTAYRGRET